MFERFLQNHTRTEIDSETGQQQTVKATCAEINSHLGLHVNRRTVVNADGKSVMITNVVSCDTAEAERKELRETVETLRVRVAAAEDESRRAMATIADMKRVQEKAILVALNAGRQIAEKLNVSLHVPIEPTAADNGKTVQVDLPGVMLSFDIFGEELTVHVLGTTEVVRYPMRGGEITNETVDAILGKLTRASWDGDKSLPTFVSLTGVVDGERQDV